MIRLIIGGLYSIIAVGAALVALNLRAWADAIATGAQRMRWFRGDWGLSSEAFRWYGAGLAFAAASVATLAFGLHSLTPVLIGLLIPIVLAAWTIAFIRRVRDGRFLAMPSRAWEILCWFAIGIIFVLGFASVR